ncbi:sigma-54-dependent Fis family transcriptional regulator [Aliigemmobacter aestuarii]|uniref:Sigma-54-dependent Fis family transcriptional regulator n=1 Tax=Aliigemmobacter aestuarii TaxID=1445661 RepID=A0A4V3V0A0_9RHOB|nr:sigma-54 dependent transcriptional regulator [Gemmobacter aestuarii]THD82980.1 sigma-54-dependent Fis family transcriptional regulator [Gemmobacter aestuarii]
MTTLMPGPTSGPAVCRRVLLVDDDRDVRLALGQTLELSGFQPTLAGSYVEAKDHIGTEFPGVVITDIRMPGKDGFALLALAQETDPDLPVILLTGEGDIPMAVRAMAAGAFDFLEKPCDPDDLTTVVDKALRTRRLVLENRALKRQIEAGDAAARMIFGRSAAAETLRARIRSVARAGAEVLITGEPGTGIPKVAEVIHLISAAASRPFLRLAGAAASPEAIARTIARAEGGSVFIDEVANLTPAAQFALLDTLEAQSAARVLAGTHRDLEAEAQSGRFHPDLFYRLDAMRIRIPPLRERPEDIPELFRRYLEQACEQAALPVPEVSPELVARLMAQDWPGNARSLMNAAMRHAMGLPDGDETGSLGLVEQMAQVERSLLVTALGRAGGNATAAALALKLPRKTFYDKLARHGIRPEDHRG